MNWSKLLILIVILCSCGQKTKILAPNNQALEKTPTLTSAQRLKKLSMHIRGFFPETEEYLALEQAGLDKKEAEFFEKKSQEYLQSKQHVAKMNMRLDELFRLQVTSVPSEENSEVPQKVSGSSYQVLNALDFLFQEVVKKNLSWDKLLLSKEYWLITPNEFNTSNTGSSDLDFFSLVKPDFKLPTPKEKTYELVQIQFDAKDPRIGGALTTNRFFGRYGTTTLNRSRGRAAAVFRIFLCDDMKASIEPKSNEELELLDKSVPDTLHKDIKKDMPNLAEEHGTDPSCYACHYKLDPLGRAFFTIGAGTLSEETSKSALVYKNSKGQKIEVEGEGLGDIAQAIVQQPQYVECQVQHFWKWFIRQDKMPAPERFTELVKKFEEVKRKPNDFIKYLVNEPEFYIEEDTQISTSLWPKIKPIFSRCDNCHSSAKPELPAFSILPIENSIEQKNWLQKISTALDLANDGAKPSMPPKKSGWKLSETEIDLIKSWLAAGAKR